MHFFYNLNCQRNNVFGDSGFSSKIAPVESFEVENSKAKSK